MEKLLQDKVCVITGAGRGIGKAIAQSFAAEGAVVIANARSTESIETWLHDEPEAVRSVISCKCFDVADSAQVRDSINSIRKEFGRIDVLVNNAGIEFNELIGMIDESHMKAMFGVNVFGAIEMLQYTSRVMMRQGGGSIVNIASVVALHGNPGQLVYSATKGAIVSATKTAAKELAQYGIRVNAVAPGVTNTDMTNKADPKKLRERISRIPMGRIAEPEDIANACLYLASELSAYVSGQILSVDGSAIM